MQRLTIVLVVVLAAALDVAAKDWRGLLPMHSTRADVVNLLGPATNPATDRLVHAGRKAVVAEAQLRATRARGYVINIRHIDPARVKAIDGGHREDLTVYLQLFPPGAAPPVPDPTIDPKDVEIVYPKKRRPRSRNH